MTIEDYEEESQEVLPFQYSITAYGVDFPVDALVKRVDSGDIYVPKFQRGYVWSMKQASRFIESLLLGLPVPGIFLSKDDDTHRLLVIDGQQRLKTLHFFYNGIFAKSGHEFALRNVQGQFTGATYRTLSEEDRRILDNSLIHATIVKQDQPSDDKSSIFHIFERLNTGGTRLSAQEIRSAIYQGGFNDIIEELNSNSKWRLLYGPVNNRMRDQELILRFFSFYYNQANYEAPMIEFLNRFMAYNRMLQRYSGDELKKVFSDCVSIILDSLGDKAFKREKIFNAAVYDSIMFGIAKRLEEGPIEDKQALKKAYESLMKNDVYILATESRTANEVQVTRRMQLAAQEFSCLK